MDIRERIIAACRELARAQGFHAITVDELAYRAGVSKRTLYRYFRSKEEVIEATLDAFMQEIGSEADRLTASRAKAADIIDSMIGYLVTRGQFLTSSRGLHDLKRHYPRLWEKIVRFRAEKMQDVIAALIQKSEREAVRRIDPRIITEAFIAAINAVANPDFILSNGMTFEETARQLIELIKYTFTGE
ncbi:MAG TPA: TetR/AcrR family transcriptional regulator [Syntrophomonadaceae bacterium]|nr:TetR/AcrR family transcriptional regulator [Syntrophomonadaceae bacterium]